MMQVQSEDEDGTPGPEVQRNGGVVGSTEDSHLAAIASLKAKQVCHSRKSVSLACFA